jgi:type III restriction/modification enzyme, methylase subunit
MIYIDPPYNTGNKFVYEDKLEHNKWLSFMEERLLISKDFLRND